jgi:hypothetical protein
VAGDPRAFNPDLVEFRGLTTLCTILNDHPGLLAKHLPALAGIFDGVLNLSEWERTDGAGFTVPWVDFAARSQIIATIRDHLRARTGPNVLHLAGLSGVGKTRTVLEACRDQQDLSGVLYIPRITELREPLLRRLTRSEHTMALVVVDEVPLADQRNFTSKVDSFSDRLRFVTIGPATRGERGRASANIFVLSEPGTYEGVLSVIRGIGAGLSEPVLESVASFAAHDLRLALLLVEATRQGDYRDLPIRNGDEVWERVTNLFKHQVGNLEAFRANYPYLTVAIDVGVKGDVRHELESVARGFDVPPARLDEVVGYATKCGLGGQPSYFFEAAPRALAGHLFRHRVWGALSNRLDTFLGGLPDRLLRRFIERCQECVGPEREEMEASLTHFFLTELNVPDVTLLVDRNRSRLFKAWAELDPKNGLEWLRVAVEQASDEQLAAFKGSSDGSGGWRGRRQIVWLCEGLASFGDSFWACEAVLFRLAQVETEQSIGNNSTEIWRGLFLPVLAFTEVPFQPRADHLMRRLANADEMTFLLVFSAVVEALAMPGGRQVPPEVIGGRIVPEPWRPESYEALDRLQRDLGQRALRVMSKMPMHCVELGRNAVVGKLGMFARHGLIQELRHFLTDVSGELKLAIRAQLRDLVEVWEARQSRQAASRPGTILEELRNWQAELQPSLLTERVQDLTALAYWKAMKTPRKPDGAKEPSPYDHLAKELLSHSEVLGQLDNWFNSTFAVSAFPLGVALGEADKGNATADIITSWLETGQCRVVVGGYLRGVSSREGTLPTEWRERLDRLSEVHPEDAALITAEADFSQVGFQRIIRLVRSGVVSATCLGVFTSPYWAPPLRSEDREDLLRILLQEQPGNREQTLHTAFSLVALWTNYGKAPPAPELVGWILQLLRASLEVRVDSGVWASLLESLATIHPGEIADLATDALTSRGPQRVILADDALHVLRGLAAHDPQLVMDAVGQRLLDPDRRPFFGLLRFKDLFEAIGLREIQRWLAEHGDEHVRFIARHLASPVLQDGVPFIPSVTDWVLTEYEADEQVFQWFCMGRHAFEVQVGHARDRRPELEQTLEPFRNHPVSWVRRWAANELEENDREIKMDDEHFDRRERM